MHKIGVETRKVLEPLIHPESAAEACKQTNLQLTIQVFRALSRDLQYERSISPNYSTVLGEETPFVLELLANELEARPFERLRRHPFPTNIYELSHSYFVTAADYVSAIAPGAHFAAPELNGHYILLNNLLINLLAYYLREPELSFGEAAVKFAEVSEPYSWARHCMESGIPLPQEDMGDADPSRPLMEDQSAQEQELGGLNPFEPA